MMRESAPGNGQWMACVVCAVVALLAGGGVEAAQAREKHITAVRITEEAGRVKVGIQGSDSLMYTSVKQAAPLGLSLYFSDTVLDTPENFFTPRNEVIHSVHASVTGASVRIQMLLKQDAAYDIQRVGNELQVLFENRGTPPPAGNMGSSVPMSSPQPRIETASTNTATRLQSVYAAKYGDSLKVFVGADGMITNYRGFTIETPARVVFDIFNISSPYRDEKIVPVNTKWVSQVRYYSYPDRVRVILDTQKAYLSQFASYPVENGLLIQMGADVPPNTTAPMLSPSSSPPVADKSSPPSPPAAGRPSRINSVYATQMTDATLVTVRGDGPITDYVTSTADNPPRIIVDIPRVDSPYAGEQAFPVETQWVKSVRHQRMGDRVQVVIETRAPYLSTFKANADANGMVIHVGGPTGVAMEGRPSLPISGAGKGMAPMPPEDREVIPDHTTPAVVNGIDFSAESAGKSVLVVTMDRPVRYDITPSGDKGFQVQLLNAKLPKNLQRPLITDRFESAVDGIVPRTDSQKPTVALLNIQLREAVPYFMEREGNSLRLHFEASSISPKPVSGLAKAPAAVTPPAVSTATSPALPPVLPDISEKAAPSPSPPVTSSLSPSEAPVLPPIEDPLLEMDEEDRPPVYTGEKIALDFYETDIKNVFRILREISGMNFAVDKDVTGKVTLTLAEPVPWDQVLDLILKMNKLGKIQEGNVIRVATRTTLDEEDRAREQRKTAKLSLKDKQKQLEPLFTEYLAVNYSNADAEIQPHVEKLITKDRGSVSVDKRTNMVIITDTKDKIRQAKELIRKLDRVTPQVMIEARVVEATTTFEKAIGTQWEMGIGVQPLGDDGFSISGLSEDNAASVNDRVGVGPARGYDALGGTYGYNMGMNFPLAAEQSGSIGFNFTRIAGTPLLLNAKLAAMETQGEGKIVSAPKVVTLDNKKAVIKQGLSYPYQTVEDGEVSLNFKDVDLRLEVTPHVTPDDRISMSLNISKNDLGNVISGQQSFTTKEAQTELLVNDGDTIVIGGIIKTTDDDSYTGIPGLSKIPILGWLFKTETKKNRKEELLIFITPRIVKLEQRSAQF